MRRIIPLSVLALGAAMACSTPETVIATTAIPTAGVRFINAVPDTGAAYGLDFRFIDVVESNSQFRVPFRNAISSGNPVSTLTEFKGAVEGSRHFVVFLDDTIQAVASVKLKDSTMALIATHNYTALLQGNARSSGADKMRLTIMDETVPDPGASIALRVVNTTGSPIDVTVYASGTTPSATPTWASIPAYSASAYVTKSPGTYLYNVKAAGGASNLVATDATVMTGSLPTIDQEANPGSLVAGTAISAFIYPPSVAGSKAPQGGAFANTVIAFNWDRRPPRSCSPLC
jgi:hypothetical protein